MEGNRDKNRLRELEEHLTADDPDLAESLRSLHWHGALRYQRWAWTAAVAAALGLVVICLLFVELGLAALFAVLALIFAAARHHTFPLPSSTSGDDSGLRP